MVRVPSTTVTATIDAISDQPIEVRVRWSHPIERFDASQVATSDFFSIEDVRLVDDGRESQFALRLSPDRTADSQDGLFITLERITDLHGNEAEPLKLTLQFATNGSASEEQ